MAISTRPNSFLQRLVGAAALDRAIYEEVETDRSATAQAFVVVLLASAAAGIGARGLGGASAVNIAFVSMVSLLAWCAWALVTYAVGAFVLPEPQTRADVGELLRTLGFAATPGMLRAFGILPGVTVPAFVVTAIWMLAATVVAVRQALDFTSTGRAVAVCVLGWGLSLIMALVLGLFFGPAVS